MDQRLLMAVPVFRNILRSLIFAVREESVKTTKIMRLENLALYGMLVVGVCAFTQQIYCRRSFNLKQLSNPSLGLSAHEPSPSAAVHSGSVSSGPAHGHRLAADIGPAE